MSELDYNELKRNCTALNHVEGFKGKAIKTIGASKAQLAKAYCKKIEALEKGGITIPADLKKYVTTIEKATEEASKVDAEKVAAKKQKAADKKVKDAEKAKKKAEGRKPRGTIKTSVVHAYMAMCVKEKKAIQKQTAIDKLNDKFEFAPATLNHPSSLMRNFYAVLEEINCEVVKKTA